MTLPRLTPRGLGLLILGFIFPLLDWGIAGLGWGGLVWDSLVLGLFWWDYQQVRAQTILLKRTFAERFSLGQANLVTLEITNLTNRQISYEIAEQLDWSLTVTPRVLTGILGTSITLTYTIKPQRRGSYDLPAAQARLCSPLGLVWRLCKLGIAEQITVYPDLENLKQVSLRLTQISGMQSAQRRGISTEFADLREYGSGDDPRFIDWKATARLGRPIIRTFQQERDQTLLILVDSGRMMLTEINGIQKFDWALNAALALALTGVRRGDRVGLGLFDSQLRIFLPPQAGNRQFEAILQRVYNQEPRLIEPDYTGIISQVLARNPRRALVVVLTDIIDPQASAELLAALAKLAPRHLPFCVTFQDPIVTAQAACIPKTVSQTFQKAVALQLIRQRAEAFRILQRRGALVLDSPVLTLSTQLIDAYLRVKARGQL